jgi:peptidoglycan-associated lipoprotein
MQRLLRPAVLLVSCLTLSLLLVGCPKRPVTRAAQAPAPSVPAVPAPVPSPAPPPPAPVAPAPAPPAPPPPPAAAPAPAPTPLPKEFLANPALADIHFDFDRATIRPGDTKILDASAAWLKSNPGQILLIEGHCDERGTNEYNLALGERRAKAAMAYLVSHGVDVTRITLISYGKERPLCTAKTERCWAQNRRAHFLTKPR